jgi:hypothetical protein
MRRVPTHALAMTVYALGRGVAELGVPVMTRGTQASAVGGVVGVGAGRDHLYDDLHDR